jgi:hypothetical protein
MKKITCLITLALLIMGAGYSCTDDFEDINKNKDKFYSVDLNNVFPGTVKRSMHLIGEVNYNKLLNFSRYGIVQSGTNPSQETGDSYFNQFYVGIIRDLEILDRDYSGKEGYENRAAIVKTWKSYIYYMMVSMYGSVPMSVAIAEGNENKRSYKYDTEPEIYTQILELLTEADELFDPSTPYANDFLDPDLVFGGATYGKSDITKWQKFANTLRLNIALHVQNLLPDLSKKQALELMSNESKLISSVNENVKLQWGNDEAMSASYYYTRFIKGVTSFSSGQYPAISEYFSLYLFSFNDPRISAYCKKSNELGSSTTKPFLYVDTITRPHLCTRKDCREYTEHIADGYNDLRYDSILVEYSMPYVPMVELNSLAFGWAWEFVPDKTYTYFDPLARTSDPYNHSFIQDDFLKEQASMVLLNWADACFLLAEAELLYGTDDRAKTYYEQGIRASMAQYGRTQMADDYLNQDGVKWNTSANGYADRRLLYRAAINGEGGKENHLEQVYKQRYIAGFFNGLEGWNLERRTRTLRFPPFFSNGASMSVTGANTTYNYFTERFIYPLSEQSKNKEAYYQGIENLRAVSPFFREDRWGDNVFTSLGFAKLNPDLATADAKYFGAKRIVSTCEYFNNKYGATYEEVVATAKSMSGETNETKALTKAFNYGFRERWSVYYYPTPPPPPTVEEIE